MPTPARWSRSTGPTCCRSRVDVRFEDIPKVASVSQSRSTTRRSQNRWPAGAVCQLGGQHPEEHAASEGRDRQATAGLQARDAGRRHVPGSQGWPTRRSMRRRRCDCTCPSNWSARRGRLVCVGGRSVGRRGAANAGHDGPAGGRGHGRNHVSGLTLASRIIARGHEGLADGDRIRVVDEEASFAAGAGPPSGMPQPLGRLPEQGG